MKKLTLIRHAKSDWHSSASTDFERPLNERGRKAAPLMGERLSERGCQPDLLLSSPAKRARQTAVEISEQIDYPQTEIEYNEGIYEASFLSLVEIIRQLDNRLTDVIMVGHNPGFSDLGQWFSPEAIDWLPTCGLLELELPLDSWQEVEADCARLLIYDFPKRKV